MTSKESDSETSENEQEDNMILNKNLSVFRKRQRNQTNDFVDLDVFKKIKNMLTCPICLEIFTNPVYVKGCSHRFCRECIQKAIRQSK